jgi:hypothetical protein
MKNNYYLRPEGNKIFMCCGKAKCPSVSVEEGMIKIEDDFGGFVKMKKEEAELIKSAVENLTDNEKG